MKKTDYLVGIGKNATGEPVGIGFRTPDEIHCYIGGGPACVGATVNAAKTLAPHYHTTWKLIDGKIKYDGGIAEEKDWFEHRCKEANCEWFVPLVKRMAAGENVPLEEIQAAYLQHNGQPMPCGEWSKLFR